MYDIATETPTQTLESPVAPAVTALVRLLDQVSEVIDTLSDAQYSKRPQGRPSGSIGAHVRHCLDHVEAFMTGITEGALSYDRRVRGTSVESSRAVALERIRQLTAALLDLDERQLKTPLRVDVQLDPAGAACTVWSTAGRELTFVISHTVHHHATMAVLLNEAGTLLPERFGVAPSTKQAPSSACAR